MGESYGLTLHKGRLLNLLRQERMGDPRWMARAPDLEGFREAAGFAAELMAEEHDRASRVVAKLVTAQGPGTPGGPTVTISHGAQLNDGGVVLGRLTARAFPWLKAMAYCVPAPMVEELVVEVEDLLLWAMVALHGHEVRLESVDDDDTIEAYAGHHLDLPALSSAVTAGRAAARLRWLSEAPRALRSVLQPLRNDLIGVWFHHTPPEAR